jgi:hypothetical protein
MRLAERRPCFAGPIIIIIIHASRPRLYTALDVLRTPWPARVFERIITGNVFIGSTAVEWWWWWLPIMGMCSGGNVRTAPENRDPSSPAY